MAKPQAIHLNNACHRICKYAAGIHAVLAVWLL